MESTNQNQTLIDNKYIIQEKIGFGGTANVYKVKEINTNKIYAAKILKNEPKYFDNEVKMLKLIKENSYMINLIDTGFGPIIKNGLSLKNKQYLILEYASKGVLFDYIYHPKRGFGEKYTKLIFKKILLGINECHKKGICHRDIKIDNILLDENFNPKIADFGFSTLIQGKDGTGILKTPLGTRSYEAPEILLKRNYNGVKVDIFSLGCVLFNLTTGKIGFEEATIRDEFYRLIMFKHYNQCWNKINNNIGVVSEEFKNLYINMICYDAKKRYEIDYILEKDPWFNEIRNLSKEEFENLEEEIKKDFSERENEIELKKGEEMNANPNYNDNDFGVNSRGVSDQEYFSLDLAIKSQKTGINMKDYIKIKGEIKPNKFMNSIMNLLKKKKKCDFDLSDKAYKFTVIFENEEEKKEEDIPKELEEELKLLLNFDEKKDDEEDDDDGVNKVESSIQVKLYKSLNNGYLVRFVKKSGSMEDYYKNLDVIKEVIRKVL